MGRKRKGRGRNTPVPQAQPGTEAKRKANERQDAIEEIASLHQKEEEKGLEEKVAGVLLDQKGTELKEGNNITKAWKEFEDLWKLANKTIEETEELKVVLEQKKADLEKREIDVSHKEAEVKKLTTEQKQAEKALLQEKADLEKKRAALIVKEEELKVGFSREFEKINDKLILKIEEVNKLERESWEKELEFKRKTLLAEKEHASRLIEKENELESKYRKQEKLLREERIELRKKLGKEREDLAIDKELLEEEKLHLEEKIERLSAQKIMQVEAQKIELERRFKGLESSYKELCQRLTEKENAERKFGNKSPEEVLAELKSNREKIRKLEEKLANSMSANQVERLEELEKLTENLRRENQALKSELSRFKTREQDYLLEVGEREMLREKLEHTESRLQLNRTALEELKLEIEGYTKNAEAKQTFEFCTLMDEDPELQAERTNIAEFRSAKPLLNYLKNKIANVEPIPLYYTDRTIRKFLGGLAMSRLSVLQGISGTGKTSLARAFSKAINGGQSGAHVIVEVQSGWRDRQDLLGYFNTFENKYYESNFLKALYKASTPQYRDTPFFIILDEMNLSHPEHYFADFLSLMEKQKEEQLLPIIASTKNLPKLIKQEHDGIYLPIPENVWFIGTANHDETTLQFAPKTFDRANLMEMPKNRENFNVSDQDNRIVSYSNLNSLFQAACEKYGKESTKANKFLHQNIRKLVNPFGLGWGNRLEKQLSRFLPVVIEAGGDEVEALDHIIASKILRPLKERFDIRAEKLLQLKKEISDAVSQSYPGSGSLVDTPHFIDEELFRLGAGNEDEEN
jgi:hypothetical protein